MTITHEEFIKYLEQSLENGGKHRAELLKWKVIAIGALSGVALGLGNPPKCSDFTVSLNLLCIVPFLAAYIDLLYRHSCIMRDFTFVFISKAQIETTDSLLKTFAAHEITRLDNKYVHSLEGAAALGSSLVVSALVALAPIAFPVEKKWPLLVSGGLGVVLAGVIQFYYSLKSHAIT
jgi:hypothetical protein